MHDYPLCISYTQLVTTFRNIILLTTDEQQRTHTLNAIHSLLSPGCAGAYLDALQEAQGNIF